MNFQIARQMIDYFAGDLRRIDHALKVYAFAAAISEGEGVEGSKREIIEACALLHDIGIPESERKYNSSAWHYQEVEGPPVARRILTELGLEESLIERVCFIIAHHHSFEYIDGIDFQVLIEADLIVNVGEKGPSTEEINRMKSDHFTTTSGSELFSSLFQHGAVQGKV